MVDFYNGNPLILEIAANHIRDIFFGDIARFLAEGKQCFDDVYALLDLFCRHLSEVEMDVLYWLAIEREPISYSELKENILSASDKERLSSTLQTLQRRLPLERSPEGLSLQPVLIEYLTLRLLEKLALEIEENTPVLLNRYALLKASGKDYIREIQRNSILKPLLQRLLDKYSSADKLAARFKQVLSTLQNQALVVPGYAGGNLTNLLSQLKISLEGWNFSHLSLWQADLRATKLHNVSFTNSHFQKTAFAEINNEIFAIACSADGRFVATGGKDNRVYLWDSATSQQVAILEGHSYWVWSLAFSPDTRLLASGSFDRTIRIWDVATARCLKVLEGHSKWVWSVAFCINGEKLVSAGYDGIVHLWDVATGNCCHTLLDTEGAILDVAISTDGRTLAVGGEEQIVWLWDIETCKLRKN